MVKGVPLYRAFLPGEHGRASCYLKNGTVCVPLLMESAMWEDAFGRCARRRDWVITAASLEKSLQGLRLPEWLRSVSKGTHNLLLCKELWTISYRHSQGRSLPPVSRRGWRGCLGHQRSFADRSAIVKRAAIGEYNWAQMAETREGRRLRVQVAM
jgi:hypothetical protein